MSAEELKAKRYRREKCVCCGAEWNVSKKAHLPREGYICPRCRNKRNIIKTASGVAAGSGAVLFALTAWMAYIERGYLALGGEAVFLLIALAGVWGLVFLRCHSGKRKTARCILNGGIHRTGWDAECISKTMSIVYHNPTELSSEEIEFLLQQEI